MGKGRECNIIIVALLQMRVPFYYLASFQLLFLFKKNFFVSFVFLTLYLFFILLIFFPLFTSSISSLCLFFPYSYSFTFLFYFSLQFSLSLVIFLSAIKFQKENRKVKKCGICEVILKQFANFVYSTLFC